MIHLLAEIPYPNIPKQVFPGTWIPVRWYGVSYLTGFILAYIVLVRLVRRGALRLSEQWLSDLVGWLALGVVAGGRIGWWIFYHKPLPDSPPEPWYEPVAIWHGGMSFHGGLTGVCLVLFIWSRIYKVSFRNIADCLALVTPIGLCLGRIANFINGELYGRVTNVAWAMRFPLGNGLFTEPRHPSQLYEAFLEGPMLLAVVWWMKTWKKRRDGQIAAGFVIFYAIFRFFVEFTREPDKELGFIYQNKIAGLGWITMGQVLSVAIGIVGIVWWIILLRDRRTALENQELATTAAATGARGFDVVPDQKPPETPAKPKSAKGKPRTTKN
jgi:phosphatidylglycerol:prolipoprotein diacylglycerol transferase